MIYDPGVAGGIETLSPRDVALGGPRAMTVRRTLPQRQRSLIGAWCFVDHYGPDDVALTGGTVVAPHPHTGLQTVSWLFGGEVEHRDSAGHHAVVRPGELNLMTAGHGISHCEVSPATTTTLHGAQLWVALVRSPDRGARTTSAPASSWWNFVGRSHDEIVGFHEGWQDQIVDGQLRPGRLGVPVDDRRAPIPAPALPHLRLRERR